MESAAINNPVKRAYNRKEVHSGDFPLGQKDDIDLDGDLKRGESIEQVSFDVNLQKEHIAKLAFGEEPLTIIIEENSRSDNPETHVPVSVNGKDAEVFTNGQWVAIGWLPVNQALTTKRKYVEVLLRAKSDSIKTVHDDATVERPRNAVRRSTSSNYPVTILEDRNPLGREWVAAIRREH